MAVSFDWSAEQLWYEFGPDSEGHTDIVTSISWLVVASDDEDPPNESKRAGISHFKWEEGDSWIPYVDLEESDCISWVQAKLGTGQVANMESSMEGDITEKETPTKSSAVNDELPWNEGDGG